MAITLSKLCANAEKTYGMKLVAGKSGMGNYVRWVHMIEDLEVADFLHGNELVFTTGIGQLGTEWLVEFVKNLHRQDAAGLVVNIGPYIGSVPPKAIVYCETNGFPLLTVPWAVRLIDVTYSFCHRIIAVEENNLGLITAFRNLIFSPDDKEAYCHVLERRGFHDESDYIVMVADIQIDGKPIETNKWNSIQLIFRQILGENTHPVCMFLQENSLVIIRKRCDANRIKSLVVKLNAAIKERISNISLHVGISDAGHGYAGIALCYKEAAATMKIAGLKEETFFRYCDLGIYALLLGVDDKQILRNFLHNTLGPLMEFDSKNNAGYMETLLCYLQNDGSVNAVANSMDLHRNTVNYRLKAIREILNTKLQNEDKMNMLLAFHIRTLLGT